LTFTRKHRLYQILFFLFRNKYLTDTFPIRVSGSIGRVSDIIFLFKNKDLTDTLPIRVSGRIGRVSVSGAYRTRYFTNFRVSGLHIVARRCGGFVVRMFIESGRFFRSQINLLEMVLLWWRLNWSGNYFPSQFNLP
jgi:hypothetical protein